MECSIRGCNKPSRNVRKGMCHMHYMRVRRYGTPFHERKGRDPHAMSRHPMYAAWSQMINRCHNPNNSSYGRYGARGIYVCDRWRHGEDGRYGFQCFLEDMGERPEGMTLDRHPDPAGPYAPGNCRWATLKQQRANITQAGDRRMREGMSRGVKAYWTTWRESRAAGE